MPKAKASAGVDKSELDRILDETDEADSEDADDKELEAIDELAREAAKAEDDSASVTEVEVDNTGLPPFPYTISPKYLNYSRDQLVTEVNSWETIEKVTTEDDVTDVELYLYLAYLNHLAAEGAKPESWPDWSDFLHTLYTSYSY